MHPEWLRPAARTDVPALLELRAEAERWLSAKGTDQWSDPETGSRAIEKWRQSIDDGRTWVVVDGDGSVLATVSRGPADRDFWHEDDHPETGFYIYKLIVSRAAAGKSLGARVIDWASRVACLEGRTWVRVDMWRTNRDLQRYYERLGFTHVRTEAPVHRLSGWLAQRPANSCAHPDAPLHVGSGLTSARSHR